MSPAASTHRKVMDLVSVDPRYRPEAYFFTLEALRFTTEALRESGHQGHIDGRQLSHGIRDYARRLFGYLGAAVFKEWGVLSTRDFGDIVFRLADAELLCKQESDAPDDFSEVYDLKAAFETEFLHPSS